MSSEKATTLTAKEAGLLAAVMRNSVGEPKIDWDQTAIDAGYNNAKTVRVMYGNLKKKIFHTAAPGSASDAPVGGVDKSSPTKKSPAKPKKATGQGESPAKPKRTRKPTIKNDVDDGDGMGEDDAEGGGPVGKVKMEAGEEEELGDVNGDLLFAQLLETNIE